MSVTGCGETSASVRYAFASVSAAPERTITVCRAVARDGGSAPFRRHDAPKGRAGARRRRRRCRRLQAEGLGPGLQLSAVLPTDRLQRSVRRDRIGLQQIQFGKLENCWIY